MEDFIKAFGQEPSKTTSTKIEYRKMGELDKAIGLARNIIAVHDFPLKVVTSQGLAQIRGFQIEMI